MNYLKKSIFKNFITFAQSKYNYQIDNYDIERDLEAKIKSNLLSPHNKMAQYQMDTIILPTISIYQSLILNQYAEKEIVESIREYVMQYYSKQAKIIKFIGKIPFFYSLFKRFFPLAMKMYPSEFWDIEWLANDKDIVAFNMRDCLYYKTFKKYNCPELTEIFCDVDNLCYDNMSNKITFIRTKTIGKNGDVCDFRFQRIK